ncbi:TPA: ZirU family protein [Salmonella enterica subsp. enterica serovar Thompson]|uniref:ZirU family protein n=1 Tax=Salmonella enterica TaxID=28901 RepID=UPI001077B3E2|nr:ZirU family protein [Salmonella enterica]EAB2146159.1 hypothetical protein [Salmonella enterica]EBV7176974.1 hypothetical protein [Salmonella enterica subsp. enterica serovar Thompson]ECY7949665.1 hypothetical protein [Salmonella enterica subsp. enterica serovar Thompson]QGK33207.1 hypothetical protein GJE06_23610 [Salmonella enterica subsp. enterica serovar Birkenhead]
MKMQRFNPTLSALSLAIMLGYSCSALAVSSAPTSAVTGHKPVLTAGTIKYTDVNGNHVLDTGDTVAVDTAFGFTDSDGDAQTPDTYQWLVGGTPVSGATGTGATYTVVAADAGKEITLQVTPHTDPALTEPAVGDTQTSNKLTVAADTTLVGVTISGGSGASGAPIVKDVLTATPQCIGGATACAGLTGLKYQWSATDRTGTGAYTPINGATNATYTVTKDDQKKALKVEVTGGTQSSVRVPATLHPLRK